MINGMAAGHNFKNGVCDCGVHLVDIQWVTLEDVGKHHIAHSGTVTVLEVQQIMELAKRMRQNIATVFGWS
jgi:hypothetical protein